jgi:hypothetical protein
VKRTAKIKTIGTPASLENIKKQVFLAQNGQKSDKNDGF